MQENRAAQRAPRQAVDATRVAAQTLDNTARALGLRRTAEIGRAVRAVTAAMAAAAYPDGDLFGMRLALAEALVNAVTHGNRGDPSKQVHVRYRVTPATASVTVRDEGEGFDPAHVADPRDPENRERPGGRGLLIMRHYLSEVRYNARGNAVTLRRHRSPA